MKVSKALAFFLCFLFIAAFSSQAAAAGSLNGSVEQYASDLSQYTSLKYFKNENAQRYIDYKLIHPDYAWETVITYVNIGLDTYFYTNPAVVANPGAADVLVNKYRSLPADFIPAKLEYISPNYSVEPLRLTHEARVAFEKLCSDAAALGYKIFATSGYRSYSYQKEIFDSFYDPNDPSSLLTQTLTAARPGFSEHQTGLAVDVTDDTGQLKVTSSVYQWYSKNAYKYGFIVRYPSGKEPILGYTNEPWHLRYLGVPLATAVYNSGLTYDEYYTREIDIPPKSADKITVGVTAKSSITVGNKTYELSTYHVLGSTYYSLRDIAAVLNGSPAQFDVAWDDTTRLISLLPGKAYSGDPIPATLEGGRAAAVSAAKPGLKKDDAVFYLKAQCVGGANYFNLIDILSILGIKVTNDGNGGMVIKP